MTVDSLSGNTFNQTISVPYNYVQYLAGNASFQAIDINPVNAGTFNSGTLALNLIGASANQSYVFPGNFTVGSDATLSVAAGVPVTINPGVTLTDDGAMSFVAGDVVTFSTYASSDTINVDTGGNLSAVNTQFINGNPGYSANININSGGQLTSIGSTFSLSNLTLNSGGELTATSSTLASSDLTLNSGSTDTLHGDVVSGIFTINSGANPIAITGNDFSLLASSATPSQRGLQAVGTPTDTINLTDNYWGTTTATQIALKINDHNTPDPTRPTVLYNPFETAPPADLGAIQGVVFNDVNGNGVQDSGEPGVAGVVVYIDANDNGSSTRASSAR